MRQSAECVNYYVYCQRHDIVYALTLVNNHQGLIQRFNSELFDNLVVVVTF